jgi:predicted metal-dependent phosphoesterase TrpH
MKEFIIDFHIHTSNSYDSTSRIDSLIKRAREIKLDGFAVTDHEFFTKVKHKEREFILIPGIEITTNYGDIIGLFVKRNIRSRNFFKVVKEIRGQKGIVVLPHPYRSHTNLEEIVKHVDCVETYNAYDNHSKNLKAKKLAKKFGKFEMGGSDAHFSNEIGNCVTKVKCESLTEESIKKAI